MKQCFCDNCGKQVNEKSLRGANINKYEVDLCEKCHLHFKHTLEDAMRKAEVEFMKTMEHQPIGFKYMCE